MTIHIEVQDETLKRFLSILLGRMDGLETRLDRVIAGEATMQATLTAISTQLQTISSKENTIMADLSQLQAEVTNNTTVEQSAITLITGLKAQLDAAGTDPVALKALSDQLAANDSALAAAVAANTPAAPPAPPATPAA